jgi:hypothetical protein
MHVPELHHWYSNDVGMLLKWSQARRPGYNTPKLHSMKSGPNVTVWPVWGQGTSPLNAAKVGVMMGYEKVVLCGVPLDNSGHYFDPPWIGTNFANEVTDTWLAHWDRQGLENVFSMSGRTREILGEY